MSDLKQTALHATHLRLEGRMVAFAGWDMPVQYSSIKEEHAAVRERAGLFDVSHMGQIYLTGPRARAAVERLVTCQIDSLRVHRARYGLLLNHEGGVIDDVMVTRTDEEELFLCVNASNVDAAREWIVAQTTSEFGGDVVVEDRSAATSLLAFQGPAARPVLDRLVDPATPLPKRFRTAQCRVAGLPVLASGTGYTGSPGFELYLDNGHAPELFEALLAEGATEGVRPAGLGARDTLRLEAALPLYGNELGIDTFPDEAGLDRFVKSFDGNFIGAAALSARAERAERDKAADGRCLVGFEMTGRGIARADYAISVDGEIVGQVTSGAPSPTLGKSIGLGYVPRSISGLGREIAIVIREKEVAARIVETPFFSH